MAFIVKQTKKKIYLIPLAEIIYQRISNDAKYTLLYRTIDFVYNLCLCVTFGVNTRKCIQMK